jgi:gluconate 5-dehydrogenase
MRDNKNILSLENKLVLVTGGGTGLGLAMAGAFADQGARVIISGRREDVLVKAAKNLGEQIYPEPFNIIDFKNIPRWLTQLEDKYGAIEILVNNAGIHIKKDVFNYTDEDFRQVILINQEAEIMLSREAGRKMALRNRGCILFISSMASQYGIPNVIGYSAS